MELTKIPEWMTLKRAVLNLGFELPGAVHDDVVRIFNECATALAAATPPLPTLVEAGSEAKMPATDGELSLLRMDLMAAQLESGMAATNYEAATLLKSANQKAIDKISNWLSRAAAATSVAGGGGEWIAVSERLPKERGYVAAATTDGRVIGVYCDPGFHWQEDDGQEGTVPASWDGGYYDDKITHWQPLPSAPQP